MLRDDVEADEPIDAARCGFRAAPQGDALRRVSGRDGLGGAVGGTVLGHRAVLPEGGGGRRPPPGGYGANAAYSLPAAVVRPVRSGGGRSVVRLGGDASVCGHRPGLGRVSLPGRHVREVGHPQRIRTTGPELPAHPIQRTGRHRVSDEFSRSCPDLHGYGARY